jgi:RNA polymerase sigma-70 factor (ECF subfamily)
MRVDENRGTLEGHMAALVIDDDVVRRAQRGDEVAFAQIVAAFQTPVFNYVLRLVHDRGLAEDLTQEIFLRVFQRLGRFSFRSKFTTWLFQVAKNRVVDELRTIERRPRAEAELDHDVLPALLPTAEQAETIDALWRAVEALPLELRMSLLLRDVTGFTYDEISEILETTLANTKWRIYQARELVAQRIVDEGLVERRPAKAA